MARRRRPLWHAKWAGLACCVVILGAFALSTQRAFLWVGPSAQHWFSLQFGAVHYMHSPGLSPPFFWYYHPGWNVMRYGGGWSSWRLAGFELHLSPRTAGSTGVTIPLWMPFLAIGIPTAGMWFFDRRRIPPNQCTKCGYNLTGNVSGVCPECGTQVKDQS